MSTVMDGIKQEHARNEQRLEALKVEVEKATSPPPPPASSAAGGSGSSSGLLSPSASAAAGRPSSSSPSNSTSSPSQSTANGKSPSRSPVNIASQLFSRNKASKPKKKKTGGGGSGSASPNNAKNAQSATLSPNGSSASPAKLEQLAAEVKATQESEMKLVSSAIGISPEGKPPVATNDGQEGSDEVLDLADQLLAQLDARKAEESSQLSASSSSPAAPGGGAPPIPASGSAVRTAAEAPLAAPRPVNAAAGATMGQAVFPSSSSSSSTSNNTVPPSSAGAGNGAALVPAESRQSATSTTSSSTAFSTASSSNSALSSASTTVPTPTATSARSHRSSSSSANKQGFGAKLKQALSPSRDSPDSSSSSSRPPIISDSSNTTADTSTTSNGSAFNPATYKNRHALRKEKKKAKEDAMRAEAEAEVEAERARGGPDPAELEKRGIDSIMRSWNLELVEMEPDGHCMYSAVADQLVSKKVDKKANYTTVRKIAADYMRKHMDDFLPYLPAEDVEGQGEGLLTPEGYMKHCDNVENTAEWGSQTELLALSKAMQIPIWVIQSRSPLIKIGSEEPYAKKKSPLIVTYHRVQYGLGEHFNSARPMPRESGMVYLG